MIRIIENIKIVKTSIVYEITKDRQLANLNSTRSTLVDGQMYSS